MFSFIFPPSMSRAATTTLPDLLFAVQDDEKAVRWSDGDREPGAAGEQWLERGQRRLVCLKPPGG